MPEIERTVLESSQWRMFFSHKEQLSLIGIESRVELKISKVNFIELLHILGCVAVSTILGLHITDFCVDPWWKNSTLQWASKPPFLQSCTRMENIFRSHDTQDWAGCLLLKVPFISTLDTRRWLQTVSIVKIFPSKAFLTMDQWFLKYLSMFL